MKYWFRRSIISHPIDFHVRKSRSRSIVAVFWGEYLNAKSLSGVFPPRPRETLGFDTESAISGLGQAVGTLNGPPQVSQPHPYLIALSFLLEA